MKLYPGEYTIMDLLQIASSRSFRTAVTPFGLDTAYHRYAGRAVMWKKAFDVAPDRVKSGLGKAIDMSRRHREPGVVFVHVEGTKTKKGKTVHISKDVLVPAKVAEMMKEAGLKVSVLGAGKTAADIIAPALRPAPVR
jgi:hypothetical protein